MFVAATFYLYDLGECKKALNRQLILLLLLGKKQKPIQTFLLTNLLKLQKKRTLFWFLSGQERLLVGLIWE